MTTKEWIHAFDVEVAVYAIVPYVRVGFSPGEFLDFLLGWFGADIAGDDPPPPTGAPPPLMRD